MNIFFLMNGNIFNYSLASEPYMLGENVVVVFLVIVGVVLHIMHMQYHQHLLEI